MAKRYARAAITRELSHSDTKPFKMTLNGQVSTVTVGNAKNDKRLVRVKRKGAKGDVDFLVDSRAKTVSCVVQGDVISLLDMSSKAKSVKRVELPPKWKFDKNHWYLFQITIILGIAVVGGYFVLPRGTALAKVVLQIGGKVNEYEDKKLLSKFLDYAVYPVVSFILSRAAQ